MLLDCTRPRFIVHRLVMKSVIYFHLKIWKGATSAGVKFEWWMLMCSFAASSSVALRAAAKQHLAVNLLDSLFSFTFSHIATQHVATTVFIPAFPHRRQESAEVSYACCLIILPLCCWRTLKDRSDWIQVLNIPWKPIKKSPRIIIPVRCHDSFLFCSIFFPGFWVTQKE